MRFAQGPSSAAADGWHTRMRRRLSVSPSPVTLNGPEMSSPGMRGTRSISGNIATGLTVESDSANERWMNATPTWRRPALILT